MRRKILLLLIVLVLTLCTGMPGSAAGAPKELTVSAAISLKNAFEEIGKLYEAKSKGVKVVFNFGASGDLVRQIEGGAPVDVFASAAQKDMDDIEKKGLAVPGSRVDFAGNSVVLVIPSNTRVQIRSFEDLQSDVIKKIAAGNPKTVPAGRYAEEVFIFYQILPTIKDKLVYSENVRQVLDYVARGEVDAGVVYSTDTMVKAKDIRIVETAPNDSHRPIIYPIAAIKGTKSEALAREFISVVTAQEGQTILEKYGFKLIKKGNKSR